MFGKTFDAFQAQIYASALQALQLKLSVDAEIAEQLSQFEFATL